MSHGGGAVGGGHGGGHGGGGGHHGGGGDGGGYYGRGRGPQGCGGIVRYLLAMAFVMAVLLLVVTSHH